MTRATPRATAQAPAWLEVRPDGVLLKIFVQPRASRTEVVGPHGEPPRLKLRVAAPPVEGEANDEVIAFLKKRLKVPASRIQLVRGDSARTKDVLCLGVSLDSALAALA